MWLFRSLICLSLSFSVFAQGSPQLSRAKHDYQSDVARLRKIVINSLYSHKEVFIRELISNANDALEKFRLTALTNQEMWNGDPLNVTIKTEKDEDGKGGRIVITDTGIGMSAEELATNLGTLAKSGTSEFLSRAENTDSSTGTGNLIGAFGLGFYSSFLVADRVEVASIPPKTEQNSEPIQHIFNSSSDENTFEVYPDPRGNTLDHGTEITLHLKSDALDYLENVKIIELINKHSSYSSTFPVYIWDRTTEEVPDEDGPEDTTPKSETEAQDTDADEAVIEEVIEKKEDKAPKTKMVSVEGWVQLNVQPPIWARDTKNLTDKDYGLFYTIFWRDFKSHPISWQHFSGDSDSGVSFKALLYLPGKLPDTFWQNPLAYKSKDVKLMVKRVFITSDFGKFALPQWISWVKAVIDADDLSLNVSRETLQSHDFLNQLSGIIVKRLLQLFKKLLDDPEKSQKVSEVYGSVFKFGAVEDAKNREKLAGLCRFATTQRNETSLDQYLENKKKGQKQIFYLAEAGKHSDDLAKSVFVEKLHARGYEVLLLNEPLDEILIQHLQTWKDFRFQDVAKAGLKFGDEDQDPEDEQEQDKALTERFQPLLDWLKEETKDIVRDVVISNRLVKSPCAIVADQMGYTANVQRMLAASARAKDGSSFINESLLKAKTMEINPRSPLIEGLLRRVRDLPEEEDPEAQQELKEIASILIDGALVRSGFDVPDSNSFFVRVDKVLRHALGVSETAPTDETVKPAPPVDPSLLIEDELPTPLDGDDSKPGIILPDHLKDKVQIEMEELGDDEYPDIHDEL